jgi:hypothetical protein
VAQYVEYISTCYAFVVISLDHRLMGWNLRLLTALSSSRGRVG